MRRPELMRNAPYGSKLPILGIVWLVFPLWIYALAVIKPIWDSLTTSGAARLTYLETNGILDAILFYAIGVVIYIVMRLRTRAQGVDADMLFATIPPD
jgi:hypothetical protein